MRNKDFLQAGLIVCSALLMANLGAMIDFYMHPEIPYFDEEHLVVGGVAGLVTAVLFGLLILYVRRLEKITKDLSDANAMCTLEIMDRKEIEETLRQKEHLLSESQRLGHVGSFFIDETGLMQWSEELYHIFGVSPDTFTPNMESFLSLLHPEDQPSMQVWVNDCMEGKKPDALNFRVIFPEGTIHYIRGDGEAVFDDKNRFLYLAGSGLDITEFKKAEEKIRKQQELTTKIIETIPLRVFWKDRDLRFLGSNTLFANDAGVTRPEELIGKTDFEMPWKDQAEMYRADDQQVMDANRPKLSYDEPQTTSEGRQFWLRTSKVPLHNDMNETIGILGVYEDITERKQAEEALHENSVELEKRNKELLEALANVKKLTGMLPICAWCKKIRDDKGYWSEVESYISEHTETVFSHGICPDCNKKMNEDIDDLTDENS